MDRQTVIPLVGMLVMLVVVEGVALLLSTPLYEAGYAAFENPESIANPFIFIGILLAFTLVLLILIRLGVKRVISLIIIFSIFFTFLYTFEALALIYLGGSDLFTLLAVGGAVLATGLLYFYPEWYVIDTLGIFIAGGVASIFGISLGIVPVIILLALLAIYDAISVYRTKHMITLAEGVVDLRTPILFVIPKKASYSYRKEGISLDEGGERGAFIIGMGDLIMPSIIVVSANVFLTTASIGGVTIPALGAILGSVAGLGFLLFYVTRGKPQAGLPPINAGAITGFLIGCALVGAWSWLPLG
jgi:presenilin-like A22 family membrane protease